MSDEVAAAKAAAEEYQSSDKDGAGPETAFDNILSGKWPSDKVHEDNRALAFRKWRCDYCYIFDIVVQECLIILPNISLR